MAGDPVNIFEFEDIARERLEKGHYDFIAGAATDEITLRRTRAVLDSINLRPKMLTDISERDLSTTVLGQRISFPVMLDPAGNHEAAHPDAELATARAAGAAGAAGTVMVLSSHAARTLEDVVSTGPLWFQQYLFKDRGLTLEMAARAEEAGYSALCITVDAKIKPKRERNIRNDYVGAPSPNYAQIDVDLGSHSWKFAADAPAGPMDIRDSAATWADVDWLAANVRLPVVIKGIMIGEDGRHAADNGAKAVIVSNHGTRYLDTTFTTIEALPEIVEAADDKIEVYMDGGIRRGTDILKALALGARAVLIGRPLFWGLAVNGEAGVSAVLEMLRDELDASMGMCGRPTIDSIDRDVIGTVSPLLGMFPTQDYRI